MKLPECCATCASFPEALKNPEYGVKYKTVHPSICVTHKNIFGKEVERWVDVPFEHPSNRVGGCQDVWANRRMNGANPTFWEMSCCYYYEVTRSDKLQSLTLREGIDAKAERLIRLKYDKEKEAKHELD